MCGIAGIYSYHSNSPAISRNELILIRDHMANRGPDGEGLWISQDERVGLAHRRLAIIDLSSNGAQPMCSNDGRYQIVFNGEIYNYKELRSLLISEGITFQSQSDTEVLLALYAHKGAHMCSLLRGMYAFSIWDAQEKSLFLARDPFGIKPLYLHDDGYSLRFSSQVKSLLAGRGISTQADPAGIVGYWIWGSIPEPFTLYKNLRSLKPGSWIKIKSDGKQISESFLSIFDVMHTNYAAPIEYENLRSALLDSIQHHLISDVPVGVFLSAGIDSTSILGLAAECGVSLNSITLGFKDFKGTKDDETILAQVAARKYGSKHQIIWLTKKDFESKVDKYIASMDQPTYDGLNTYLVADAAAQIGVKVVLSGLGGDELFGGYPSFTQVPLIHGLGKRFPSSNLIAKLLRQSSAPILRKFTSEKYAGILEYGSTWESAYMLRRAIRMPWELKAIKTLDKEIINEGLVTLYKHHISDKKLNELGSPFAIISYLESSKYMLNQLLRDSDWAGMAHSIEIRLPFLDIHLLQYLAQQRRNLDIIHRKYDISSTVHPQLPKEIWTRRKTGFSTPLQKWTKEIIDSEKHQRGFRGWQTKVLELYTSRS